MFKGKLSSTRFFIIQEGIVVGCLAAAAKVVFPDFPLATLLTYLAPIIVGAYGFKTFQHVKEDKKEKGGDHESYR